jgi:hypothetical protein
MFRIRPDTTANDLGLGQADAGPGFRVGPPDQVPGLHNFKPPQEVVPGFRVNADGSARVGYPPAGNTAFLEPVQWTAEPAGHRDARGISHKPVTLGDLAGRVANRIGTHANAVVNGAYSVFPGVYDAGRAVARGTGLLGQEEFRRFGQEADVVGGLLGGVARHPEASVRIARQAISSLDEDPLFRYYMAGRAAMGFLTGLGPAAMAGDALRAIERGHTAIDAYKYGVQGRLPAER